MKICPICEKEFFADKDCKSRTQIFCSRQCYGKSIAKYKKCFNCGKEFYNFANKMFCSMKCSGQYRIGKKLSVEHRKKLSEVKKGKPIKHFIEHNDEIRKKISESLTGKPQPWNQNEKHNMWKGKKAGYTAFHQWVFRKRGRASKCENPICKYPKKNTRGKIMYSPSRYEWALIKGKKHDHNCKNYMQLCPSCHRLYDMDKIEI